jgi:hypothetical protein
MFKDKNRFSAYHHLGLVVVGVEPHVLRRPVLVVHQAHRICSAKKQNSMVCHPAASSK